jgi:mRNA interferase RelE/StbE
LKYKVEITHTAKKYLSTLSKANYQLVVNAVNSLSVDPYQTGIKKLKGVKNVFRKRAGNYRIVYKIDGTILVVTVISIGNRKDIYE